MYLSIFKFGEILRALLDSNDIEPNEVLEVFISQHFLRFLN